MVGSGSQLCNSITCTGPITVSNALHPDEAATLTTHSMYTPCSALARALHVTKSYISLCTQCCAQKSLIEWFCHTLPFPCCDNWKEFFCVVALSAASLKGSHLSFDGV